MEEFEDTLSSEPPIWAVFGDLMSGLVGIFVLLLIWFIGYQLELITSLESEVGKREAEQERRVALEKEVEKTRADQLRLARLEEALADPLAKGRVTLVNGRIGISGSVLFSLNSDELQPDGRKLLKSLVGPLRVYLGQREELLMVSGFTDDLPIQKGNLHFKDNWELSAKRALTVTRVMIEEGMPPSLVFAAAFGAHHPVVSNSDSEGRAKNRRVELAPVPKSAQSQSVNLANSASLINASPAAIVQ